MIVIIDFGSQFNQLIARRVREHQIYCQILPSNESFEKIKKLKPKGIILSGGPASIYEKNSPTLDKKIFELGAFDRRKIQTNARNSIQAEKCQACHKDLYKNEKGEPISEIGRLCHDAFFGKNGETRQTCAGCHINVAHLPEFDRYLPVNAEFAQKLMENQPAEADKGGQN